MSLSDDINALASADSAEALWYCHCRIMERYGLTRLLYGFTHYRAGKSFGDPQDFLILSNMDRGYLDWFVGDEAFKLAPMVGWAMTHSGAMSWRQISQAYEAGSLSEQERQIIERNRTAGLVAGYTISFETATPRAKGAIALAAAPGVTQGALDAAWAEHGAEINALNNMAHYKLMSLPHTPAARNLTERQKEVLHWVGDGKTVADTALIMGLTPATVEKHLRLARAVLAVETTAQAVLKAALQKQIFVLEY